MTQLIFLVVAAAWLAVLIPPMLRSRVENRPNSSVHDFRRQLSKLQSTATPPRGTVRAMGRPLASSPLQRPAAAGRPGQPTLRSGVRRHDEIHVPRHAPAPQRTLEPRHEPHAAGRYRSHGDPTGGQPRHHGGHTAMRVHRDTTRPTARPADPRTAVKRRRSNVLFVLLVTAACSLFLAATTSSTVMLYVFALSFLALCGYVYLLAQLRQREQTGSYDGWFEQY